MAYRAPCHTSICQRVLSLHLPYTLCTFTFLTIHINCTQPTLSVPYVKGYSTIHTKPMPVSYQPLHFSSVHMPMCIVHYPIQTSSIGTKASGNLCMCVCVGVCVCACVLVCVLCVFLCVDGGSALCIRPLSVVAYQKASLGSPEMAYLSSWWPWLGQMPILMTIFYARPEKYPKDVPTSILGSKWSTHQL